MKALMITAPNQAEVWEVPNPVAVPGEVIVDVKRAGICGTDIEFFTGEMSYLHDGFAKLPMSIGHEWMGVISAVGDGVDKSWIGKRVTGDTMLGCGKCRRCKSGLQHVCEFRFEIGIRGGRPGGLAEQIPVPVSALHVLPDSINETAGALVEPGGNAFRSVQAANLKSGERVLITGAGTIALLCAMFAKAQGAEVHLLGRSERSRKFAQSMGFDETWSEADLPELPWDAVIEASNAQPLPAKAVDLVEPGRRVVYIGLSVEPSLVDSRKIALKDVTAVGILSASPGLAGTIKSFAAGEVDPTPLVAKTVSLEEMPAILAGERPAGSGAGPKFHCAM